MTTLPKTTSAKKLGLVIDLDTCVGCHACVVSCKGWNTENYGAPLSDQDPYGSDPSGTFLNRVHSYEVQPETGPAQLIHFPKILPALRRRALRHRLPHLARAISVQRMGLCWSMRMPALAAVFVLGPALMGRGRWIKRQV
jgi:ferredoxin